MDVEDCLINRRSVRFFKNEEVSDDIVMELLEIAINAPSGKNAQPWRFQVIDIRTIMKIAKYMKGNTWFEKVPKAVVVYLDKNRSYDFVRDIQSCGAVIQNFLIAAYAKGLGTCWVGEILNYKEIIMEHMMVDSDGLELMAVIAVGYPKYIGKAPGRMSIDFFVI